jgi:hypothetical protein
MSEGGMILLFSLGTFTSEFQLFMTACTLKVLIKLSFVFLPIYSLGRRTLLWKIMIPKSQKKILLLHLLLKLPPILN